MYLCNRRTLRVLSLHVPVCMCVLAGAGLVTGWLATVVCVLSLGSLAGEPCYYRSLVTHRHHQQCIRIWSNFQTFLRIELSRQTVKEPQIK